MRGRTGTSTLAAVIIIVLAMVGVAPGQAEVAAKQKPPKPVVTKLTPSSGSTTGGTLVTIKGKNLATASKVLFGTAKGTQLKVKSDHKLKVVTPAHAEGVVDVKIKSKGGKSAKVAAARFTFVSGLPQVTAVSPASGPGAGGTVVTVTGTGFAGVTAVTFGGTPGTFSVPSSTQLKVTTPAHAAGVVDVRVTTGGGISPIVAADHFEFLAASPVAPQVTAVSPAAAPDTGGTLVTITGAGFVSGSTSVVFDAVAGTGVNVTSATQLTVTTPAHPAGVVDVRVTTAGGTSPVVAADHFTFQPVPRASAGSLPADADADPGTVLNSVSCGAPESCFAVGSYLADGAITPLVERRTGPNTWVGTTPGLPPDAGAGSEVELVDVDCPSASFCVAVGTYFDNTQPTARFLPLIETWDGSAWTPSTTALPNDSDDTQARLLEDVDCAATTSCVAVGRYDASGGDLVGLTLTLDQSAWSSQAVLPVVPGSSADLYAVDCRTASACAAVGVETDTGIGTSAPLAATGAPGSLAADSPVDLPGDADPADQQVEFLHVSCLSATQCVAGGSYRTTVPSTQAFLEVLAGGSWTTVPVLAPADADDDPDLHVRDVSCSTTCAAVGDYLGSGGSPLRPLLVSNAETTPVVVGGEVPANAQPDLNAASATVTCAGALRCLGVGAYDVNPATQAPLLSHLTGSGWAASAGPLPVDFGSSPQPVASTLDGTVVVAVGYYVDTGGNTRPLLMVDLPFDPPA